MSIIELDDDARRHFIGTPYVGGYVLNGHQRYRIISILSAALSMESTKARGCESIVEGTIKWILSRDHLVEM